MNLTVTLKLICDLCFYFAFANTISAIFGGDPVILALPVFALCVYLCPVLIPKGKARYIPLAVLPACFFVVPLSLPNAIVILPAVIYVAISVHTLAEIPETFSYNDIFFLFLKVYIPFIIVMLIAGAASHLESSSLLFAFIFLALSVMLMRMLRHSADTLAQTRFKIVNSIQVFAVVLLGVIFGSKRFLGILSSALAFAYLNIIAPILWFLISCFLFILRPLLSLIGPVSERDRPPVEFGDMSMGDMAEENPEPPNAVLLNFIKAIFILLLIALAVFLIYKFFKKILAFDSDTDDAEQSKTARTTIPVNPAQAKRGNSNENQIRAVYRRFIIACEKRGIEKRSYMTSADYRRCTEDQFESADDAELFREFYINVRYGDKDAGKDGLRKMKDIFSYFKKQAPH